MRRRAGARGRVNGVRMRGICRGWRKVSRGGTPCDSVLVMALKLATTEDDRVLAAVRHAPIVEASAEEMAAFEEGLADIRSGRTVSAAQVRARIQARENE